MIPPNDIRIGFLTLVALAAAGPGAPASAQPRPGEVTDSFVSPYDGRSRHALYVPSDYTPERQWPLVLIMDARGRALLPLERMIPAAERWGYILVSSYDTASDGPSEPNEIALEAMLEDAQDLFAVDTRRLYFVGFSGTARQAMTFGRQLAANTQGVIGFGAGLPSPTFLLRLRMDGDPAPFAFFGGAGRLDFNYDEVRRLDERLDESGIAHRLRFYDGPHAWPGQDVFSDAMEWMEVQSIRSGVVQRGAAVVDALYEAQRARASSFEASDDLLGAADAYRALVEGFDGVRPTPEAREALDRIVASAEYRARRDRLEELGHERRAFDERFRVFLDAVRDEASPFDVEDAVERLGLRDHLRRSDDLTDEGLLHRRILEAVFVRASFYEPGPLLEARDWDKAEAFYRLADRIRPDSPRVCLGLARVWAQTGAEDEALAALSCAAASPALAAHDVRDDELLAPLRENRGFQALLEELERRR